MCTCKGTRAANAPPWSRPRTWTVSLTFPYRASTCRRTRCPARARRSSLLLHHPRRRCGVGTLACWLGSTSSLNPCCSISPPRCRSNRHHHRNSSSNRRFNITNRSPPGRCCLLDGRCRPRARCRCRTRFRPRGGRRWLITCPEARTACWSRSTRRRAEMMNRCPSRRVSVGVEVTHPCACPAVLRPPVQLRSVPRVGGHHRH